MADQRRKLPDHCYWIPNRNGIVIRMKMPPGYINPRTRKPQPMLSKKVKGYTSDEELGIIVKSFAAERDAFVNTKSQPQTFNGLRVQYQRERKVLRAKTAQERDQQLEWWSWQLAALDAEVLTPTEYRARRDAGSLPAPELTIGATPRVALQKKRFKQILDQAFKAQDGQPQDQFNANHDSHLSAVSNLFVIIDDGTERVNPVRGIKRWGLRTKKKQGAEPRVWRYIRKFLSSSVAARPQGGTAAKGKGGKGKNGRPAEVGTLLRYDLLTNTLGLTPERLMQLGDPREHFHDVPDATDAEIRDGLISVYLPPRYKGKQTSPREWEMLPLTPDAVAAWRAYVACPAAWDKKYQRTGTRVDRGHGYFSVSSFRKQVQAAARRAQPELEKLGYPQHAGLLTLNVKRMRHSMASAAKLASNGIYDDRTGNITTPEGLQKFMHHKSARTTDIYTQAMVDPAMRHVSACLTDWLTVHYAQPWGAPLRLVARGNPSQVQSPDANPTAVEG